MRVRYIVLHCCYLGFSVSLAFFLERACTGVLISLYPDLLPDVFCLMVRIFPLMLVLLYIYSTNIPPIMIINRIYENQNFLSL